MRVKMYQPCENDLVKYLNDNIGTFYIQFNSSLLLTDEKSNIGSINKVEVISMTTIEMDNRPKPIDIKGIIYDLDILKSNEKDNILIISVNIPKRVYIIEYEMLRYFPNISTTKINNTSYHRKFEEKQRSLKIDISNVFQETNGNAFKKTLCKIDNLIKHVMEKDFIDTYLEVIDEIKNRYYKDVYSIPKDKLRPYIWREI